MTVYSVCFVRRKEVDKIYRVFGNSRGKTNVLIWALRPNAQSTRRPE